MISVDKCGAGVICCVAVAALFAGGCAAYSSDLAPSFDEGVSARNGAIRDSGLSSNLDAARRLMASGNYSQALPRLHELAERYPEEAAGIEAHYWLGEAYVALGGEAKAREYFEEYVRRAPEGAYAGEARARSEAIASAQEEASPHTDAVTARIATLERQWAADPGALAAGLELADLYWRRDEYARAGEIYMQILEKWPELAEDAVVRTRVVKGENGAWVLQTPRNVILEEAARDPLIFFNTQSFRSGRNQGYPRGGLNDRYSVSGQVMNRGPVPLKEVSVIVTIYGFPNLVYESRTLPIGTLRPGERRAFSTQFTNFDDIENVSRFECTGTYTR
jgi:tetratricopeptide (TPR) repeat protein